MTMIKSIITTCAILFFASISLFDIKGTTDSFSNVNLLVAGLFLLGAFIVLFTKVNSMVKKQAFGDIIIAALGASLTAVFIGLKVAPNGNSIIGAICAASAAEMILVGLDSMSSSLKRLGTVQEERV